MCGKYFTICTQTLDYTSTLETLPLTTLLTPTKVSKLMHTNDVASLLDTQLIHQNGSKNARCYQNAVHSTTAFRSSCDNHYQPTRSHALLLLRRRSMSGSVRFRINLHVQDDQKLRLRTRLLTKFNTGPDSNRDSPSRTKRVGTYLNLNSCHPHETGIPH